MTTRSPIRPFARASVGGVPLLALGCAAALAATAAAQQPPVNGMRPADPARHALVGATVIVAPGVTLEKATVVIRDGVIEAIGADVTPPAGYRVFDFSGKTIFPAFIEPALVTDSAEAAAAALRAPGAHWNASITPEVHARDLAVPDATVDALRAQGFVIASVVPKDGIVRGTSEVRLLVKPSEGVAGRDIGGRTMQAIGPRRFDFSRSGGQTPGTAPTAPRGERSYPSSLMGAYALLRQTLADARWRAECAKVPGAVVPPEDLNALDALLPLVSGRQSLLVDAGDELEAARFIRLARDEMPSAPLVVLGSGLEFRAQDELLALLAESGAPILVPIDFPQVPDLVSPTASESISLRDLMTWRYAPTNPKRLVAGGANLALTTHRMQDVGSFRRKLADAIAHGLSKDEALAALTTAPARILGIDARAGTLEKGKLANLVVSAGDPFDADSKYEAVFVAGAPVVLPPETPVLASGRFTVESLEPARARVAAGLVVEIDPKSSSIKFAWTPEVDPTAAKEDAEEGAAPVANPDTDAKPDGEATRDSDGEKPAETTAAARRTSVADGRAAGMIDGKALGLEGEIRFSIAGSGERATMTVETTAGERHAFALARAKPADDGVAKERDPKTEPTQEEGAKANADATTDGSAPSGEDASGGRRGRGRGARGEGGKDDAKDGKGADSDDDRTNLWKDRLPFPFGEYGRTTPPLSGTVLVKDATIWTLGAQGTIEGGDMLVVDGRIAAVAEEIAAPEGATVIDGRGRHVTPGLIDCHSHTGISGGVNEGTQASTAEVTIGDVVDPTDINWYRQLAGGLVAANQLHGSANPIGGRNSVVKIRWGAGADGFRIDGAPAGIKFALGENVVRSQSRYPNTRMGVATFIEDSFLAAREYRARQQAYAALDDAARARTLPPRPDLELETLAEILEGTRLVHCHSYRQDEILMLIRLADRLGFRIGTFQHVLEGYKVAPEIAAHGAGASSFSDWWAYKIEVMDAIPWNGAMLEKAGVLVSFNSDSDELARRMNMEAAKAVRYGNLAPEEALKFVTLNPAKQLGIDARTGSLEPGKDADFVLWNGDPLSAFTRCEETWIDGERRYSRAEEAELRAATIAARGALIAKATAGADRGRQAGGPSASGEGFRGRRGRGAPTLLERMLEDREDAIWIAIARGLDPFAGKPGVCGCDDAPVPASAMEGR
ncbi:MAG: hypothetical protein RI967_842 [Planctomycetota bacterium]